MPYPHNSFDLVFNEGVIEHYSLNRKPNYLDAIHEMMRITKKGGKIIVAVPNWYNFPHTLYKWILAKLGKNYIYGYEKSFKHSELIKIFSELGLINCEINGFFPAHGFYRLSGRGAKKFFFFVGRLSNKLESFFDGHFDGKFSKLFGIEIVIKGEKT
jgi:predicted SAM-dependent methyltransferase